MLPPQREHDLAKITVFKKTPKTEPPGTNFGTQNERKSTSEGPKITDFAQKTFFGRVPFFTHFSDSFFHEFWAPRGAVLARLSADFRDFLGYCWVACGFPVLQDARGGDRERVWVSWGPPPGRILGGIWKDFLWICASLLFCCCPAFLQVLSKVRIRR